MGGTEERRNGWKERESRKGIGGKRTRWSWAAGRAGKGAEEKEVEENIEECKEKCDGGRGGRWRRVGT